jgi:hypothetical protein
MSIDRSQTLEKLSDKMDFARKLLATTTGMDREDAYTALSELQELADVIRLGKPDEIILGVAADLALDQLLVVSGAEPKT